jgi:hypothetical protein
MAADREKFVRQANKRVNAAIRAIQEVAKLSNTALYEYTERDVELIFESLEKELAACRKSFELAMNVQSWVDFSLDEGRERGVDGEEE